MKHIESHLDQTNIHILLSNPFEKNMYFYFDDIYIDALSFISFLLTVGSKA